MRHEVRLGKLQNSKPEHNWVAIAILNCGVKIQIPFRTPDAARDYLLEHYAANEFSAGDAPTGILSTDSPRVAAD